MENGCKPIRAGYRWVCVKQFRHYRSGKMIIASNYGYEFFYFPVRCKK